MANGGANSVRVIEGQKSLLGRTMHAIAYDPIHDEFTVPQEFGQAILTFRGAATGEEPPVRVIQGPLTRIQDVSRLDVDFVNNEIFVPQDDEVLVFPREGNGNVAPVRVIKGPDTQLGAAAVGIDTVHNLLVVAGQQRRVGARLLVFDRAASGNAKPKASIGGPKSGFKSLGGPFAVYGPKGEIIVSVRGVGGTEENPLMSSEDCFVGVWSVTDNGDVPPHYVIGGPNGVLRMVRGVALDPKNKSIIVSDKRLNAVMTFYFPEMF